MKYITTLKIIFDLIPTLIVAMKAIEDAIPGNGKGEQKLAAIRQIVEATNDSLKELWPMLEKTINILIGLFNATGAFKK